jgi:hypothetical protein
VLIIKLQNFRNWNGVIWSSYAFSMNYVSSINYFPIKNLFSISFIPFKRSLDWASISVKHRGLGVKFCRHREYHWWTAGSKSRKSEGSLTKVTRERVPVIVGRWI